MPPSFTRSSSMDCMKHACGWGLEYESSDSVSSAVSGSTYQKPCFGPVRSYLWLSPVLNHCGLLGAAICVASMYLSSSSKACASSAVAK